MINFATGDGRFSTSRTFLYFSVFFATGVFVKSNSPLSQIVENIKSKL
jgi:hypothetical protein